MKTQYLLILISVLCGLTSINTNAQCNWQTEITDGYEYNTIVPGLIPGKTIHNTPQSYAVHSGNTSLYMNFVNCNGGMGACAGDKIYERKIPACPFQRYRFSTWLTTSFSGTQSNVRISISDNSGNILDDQLSINAPYFPSWIQYQSPEVIPLSDTIIFTLYTNVPGVQSGNDLSMDDFLMEKCLAPYTSLNTSIVCGNDIASDLFTFVPFQNSINGTWSGPSTLTGGYLGTFDPNSNTSGIYIYTNEPFGSTCPTAFDSVDITLVSPPSPELGPDTTLCSNQSIILNSGTGAGYTYLWNNGVTGPIVNASAPGGNPAIINYSVTVTDSLGCSATDSITVDFILCLGLDENIYSNNIRLYPIPANEKITLELEKPFVKPTQVSVYNNLGEVIKSITIEPGLTKMTFPLTGLNSGLYFMSVLDNNSFIKQIKFVISE